VVRFVADDAAGGDQHAEASAARREPSPAPAEMAPCSRAPRRTTAPRPEAWGGPSEASSLAGSGCSHGSPSTESDEDSDAGEVAEESVFAKAAQRRRTRRSVTANHGSGLPAHTLPAMATSRLLARRRGFLDAVTGGAQTA
ncbi:unnamed protein product, partial [Prorocentrum cordatum]